MTPPSRDARNAANRCAHCEYDFQDLDFSRSTNCPECGRPVCARVPGGMSRHEELACAVGWIAGAAWFVVFLFSMALGMAFGVGEPWWWWGYLPLTCFVLAAMINGINFLGFPETRHRRLALCLAIVPVIAWAGLVALVIRAVLA